MYDGPTFGLVHGAWNRGSCWAPLVTELKRRGLPCVVVDLPSDQPDAGVDDYAEHVVHRWKHVTGPLVLVGHSLGGLTVPVVASRRPVVLPAWSRQVAPERLGVHPRQLGGGHCPMLAQPSSLADELVTIAQAHGLLVPASFQD